MKITDMRMEVYRWKRDNPIRNGLYVYSEAGLNVIRIETDEGITGLGLGGGANDDGQIGVSIANHFKQVVIGQDPFDNEFIWDAIWQPKLVGRRGMTTHVISAMDIALWDIKGKACGGPCTSFLVASATACQYISPAATMRKARDWKSWRPR